MSIPTSKYCSISLLLTLSLLMPACSRVNSSSSPRPPSASSAPMNVFDEYMKSVPIPADGFDFSVGDENGRGSYTDKATGKQFSGWYIATHFNEVYSMGIHTGEDWNGNGGGNTDLGQDVHAVANGLVVFAQNCGKLWGNVIVIEHTFYENFEKKKIRSVYAHLLEIKVRQGEEVRRRQVIALVGQDPDKLFDAHLHLELRWDDTLAPNYWPSSNGKDQSWIAEHYAEPSTFINSHRSTPVPQQEQTLVLVDQTGYRARLYKRGQVQGEYDVSFGQEKGQKRLEGDNRTPKGMYFVTQKYNGPFDSPYGQYYGGHWIKINYPNKYDASWGLGQKLISAKDAQQIEANWGKRIPTLEKTKLGGGIGFHGWANEWENNGPRHLSWGCVVLHLKDIDQFYQNVSEGTMVIIF
jgi:murein DD-endopeptidase MepM/ murein hydrolase activator NlpD